MIDGAQNRHRVSMSSYHDAVVEEARNIRKHVVASGDSTSLACELRPLENKHHVSASILSSNFEYLWLESLPWHRRIHSGLGGLFDCYLWCISLFSHPVPETSLLSMQYSRSYSCGTQLI